MLALDAQTKALVVGFARPHGSTIRVEPRITWPKLGDDGSGGREVEEFYDKLEENYGLANSGKRHVCQRNAGCYHVLFAWLSEAHL